jgi:hypothetical protein
MAAITPKVGYGKKFLRYGEDGKLDEKKTMEAIRDKYDFENAWHAPAGKLTELMESIVDLEKYQFEASIADFDDEYLEGWYYERMAHYGVDCAQTFVEEHMYGYIQHMSDNYGLDGTDTRKLLMFHGGVDWRDLSAFDEYGLGFLDQVVSVCEENDDIENPHDKAATEKLRAEERATRRLAKRAKMN